MAALKPERPGCLRHAEFAAPEFREQRLSLERIYPFGQTAAPRRHRRRRAAGKGQADRLRVNLVRQQHQPLGLPSAGSVFRNPEGDSAGGIIDRLGLKGLRIGGAVVSEKHANFIVNDQKGSAADVRALGETVRERVRSEIGIELVFEIVFAGDWSGWESDAA